MYKRTSELAPLAVRRTTPNRHGENVTVEHRYLAIGETVDGRKVIGLVDQYATDYLTHMTYEFDYGFGDAVQQNELWYFDAGTTCPEIVTTRDAMNAAIDVLLEAEK